MSDWMMWAALAGVVVILELFTGTFYLLMIAIGMIAGAGAAWFGAAKAMQLIVAAIIGVIATVLLRRSRFGKFHRTDALRDPNVNLDIGQTIQIHSWNAGPDGHYSTRAMYRGAQ